MIVKINSISYFFAQAFKSIARNKWMSIASAGTVAISLFICGLFFLLVINTNQMAANLESSVEITVFLKPDAAKEQVKIAGDILAKQNGVKEISYISKEKALEGLQKQFADKSNLIKAIGTNNPLPDSYKITVLKPEMVIPIAKIAEGIDGVWKVHYGKGTVEKIFSIVKWVRGIGLVLMLLLAFGALFLISTTIRLTIHARKKEITIMKYVGATEWFVRWPFLLEGMLLGLAGTLVASVILYFVYLGIVNSLGMALTFLPLIKDPKVILQVDAVLLAVGALLGAIGSSIAMRKFLRA